MLKVMFLCTGNSCRSQMAEGLARALGKGSVEAYSAGLIPVGINPYARRVMKEAGIDISGQRSEPIDEALLGEMDVIITLCGNAEASCPATPAGVKRLHWPVRDPVGTVGSEEEILEAFRKTRDEIRKRIEDFLGSVDSPGHGR